MPPALFIMGPTAAGKTDLALNVAKHYPVEIISVDSALVYRGMDIGTAKPDPKTLQKFPHHLVDIIDPTESYSAGNFCSDALKLMADITQRGKIPLLVGGSMLYFKTLQHGLADLPSADPDIRRDLDELTERHGIAYLHKRLAMIDPISAERINVNDPQRIQRALEVYELTGKTLTQLTTVSNTIFPYRVIKVILTPFDRRVLHARIAERYNNMIKNGFIDEVKVLFHRGDCHPKLPSIRAVGYRQAWQFLSGDYDLDTMIYKAIVATRQMAKRQLTWLRSSYDGVWFDSDPDLPIDQVLTYLSNEIV